MKVSKAIELLTDSISGHDPWLDPDLKDSTKLGIEALKALRYMRGAALRTVCTQMHGETPEDDTT